MHSAFGCLLMSSSCCCRCNGSGRCKNCVCVEAGRTCSNCLPTRRGRCRNTSSFLNSGGGPEGEGFGGGNEEGLGGGGGGGERRGLGEASQTVRCSRMARRRMYRVSSAALFRLLVLPLLSTVLRWCLGLLPYLVHQAPFTFLHSFHLLELLHPFPELPPSSVMAQAHFTWGPSEVSSEQFVQTVNAAYSEIVHWRRNVFSVPSGKAGKAFVSELARLFQSYADGSTFETIPLTVAMILPQLLLQKPSPKSKAHEHSKCLAQRLEIWKAGDILSLLEEGRAIQSRLLVAKPQPSTSNQEHTARAFAKLMFQGSPSSNHRAEWRL